VIAVYVHNTERIQALVIIMPCEWSSLCNVLYYNWTYRFKGNCKVTQRGLKSWLCFSL